MRWFTMSIFAAFSVFVFSTVGFVSSWQPEESCYPEPKNCYGFLSRDTDYGKEIILRIKSTCPGSEWHRLVDSSNSPIVSVSKPNLSYNGVSLVAEAHKDGTAVLRPPTAYEKGKRPSWCSLDD